MSEEIVMQQGKIYYISYGGLVQVVGRYKDSDVCHHFFFSHLHYWNGYERYKSGGWCVKTGIEEIREATQAEKYNLFRNELEKGDV